MDVNPIWTGPGRRRAMSGQICAGFEKIHKVASPQHRALTHCGQGSRDNPTTQDHLSKLEREGHGGQLLGVDEVHDADGKFLAWWGVKPRGTSASFATDGRLTVCCISAETQVLLTASAGHLHCRRYGPGRWLVKDWHDRASRCSGTETRKVPLLRNNMQSEPGRTTAESQELDCSKCNDGASLPSVMTEHRQSGAREAQEGGQAQIPSPHPCM